MPTPLGVPTGYLSNASQSATRPNALLRQGQFSGFDRMGEGQGPWFRRGWRDWFGRGSVRQEIDLGPMASDNAMLQYKPLTPTADSSQFKFF